MKRAAAIACALLMGACSAEPSDPSPETTQTASEERSPVAAKSDAASRTSPSSVGSPVECQPGEKVVFSCKTNGSKSISVCAAPGKPMEYRFGKDAAEIALPIAEFAQVMYSGGNEVQAGFDAGDVRYVVFSRMVRTNFEAGEPNNPAMSDGVIVTRAGKFAGMHLCTEDGGGLDLNALDVAVSRRADLLTDETYRADPEWARN